MRLEVHCVTHPQVGVERAIIHELHDYHGRVYLGYHTIQLDDIVMIKLAHDGCLIQEVSPHLPTGARLHVDKHVNPASMLTSPDSPKSLTQHSIWAQSSYHNMN